MKRSVCAALCRGIALMLLPVMLVVFCGCDMIGCAKYRSFDIGKQGLVYVKTRSDRDGTEECFALAPNGRIMRVDSFEPDGMEVFKAFGFTVTTKSWSNRIVDLSVRDENNNKKPITKEFVTICHAMEEIDASVLSCRIFHV